MVLCRRWMGAPAPLASKVFVVKNTCLHMSMAPAALHIPAAMPEPLHPLPMTPHPSWLPASSATGAQLRMACHSMTV
jgi:hypothetical protein